MMELSFMSDESLRIAAFLKGVSKISSSPNPNKPVKRTKDPEKSEALRKAANEMRSRHDQNFDTLRVLRLYSRSIALAQPLSDEIKLAYYARSDFSFQLGLFAECIEDLDRILSLDCPQNLKLKILYRKAECSLKNLDELDKNIIDDITRKIADLKLDNVLKNKFIQKIRKHEESVKPISYLELREQVLQESIRKSHQQKKPFKINFQEEIPCASNSVSIKYDEKYGRKIIATENILPGEVLAIEKIYTMALEPSAFYSHCNNCAKIAWASVPCNDCSYAVYCSEQCKVEAWNMYHEVECKITSELIDTYEEVDKCRMVLALRIVIKAVNENKGDIPVLRENLRKIDTAPDQCRRGFTENEKWLSNHRSVLSLVSNAYKRDITDLMRVSQLSSRALHHLVEGTNLFEKSINRQSYEEDVVFIGALISRVYHMILFNQFCMMENQDITPRRPFLFSLLSGKDDIFSMTTDEAGLGAFISPFCSLLNHSCFPNAATCFTENGEVILYSLSSINKGSQLFICYAKLCAQRQKSTRQDILKNLFIDCDCAPCKEDWPRLDEAPMLRTKTRHPLILALVSEVYKLRDNPNANGRLMKKMVEDALEEITIGSMYPTKEFYELTEMLLHIFVTSYGKWFQVPISTMQK